MKAKTTILAALAVLAGAAFGDDGATLVAGLKQDILTLVDQVNPIDATTGARKYISFAMISDIHKCKRVAGDDAASDPVTTYWYGSHGVLTEAEQSIRLLGAVAEDAGLDAVINGGDFSTAPVIGDGTIKGLTEAEYTNEIWNVKAMFDRYLPGSLPRFTVDGNHERSYTENGANMQISDAAWAYVLTNFNPSAAAAAAQGVDVTYHRDLAAPGSATTRRGPSLATPTTSTSAGSSRAAGATSASPASACTTPPRAATPSTASSTRRSSTMRPATCTTRP